MSVPVNPVSGRVGERPVRVERHLTVGRLRGTRRRQRVVVGVGVVAQHTRRRHRQGFAFVGDVGVTDRDRCGVRHPRTARSRPRRTARSPYIRKSSTRPSNLGSGQLVPPTRLAVVVPPTPTSPIPMVKSSRVTHQLTVEVELAGGAPHGEHHVRPLVQRQVVARAQRQPLLGRVARRLERRREPGRAARRAACVDDCSRKNVSVLSADLEQRDPVGQRVRSGPDRHGELVVHACLDVVGQVDLVAACPEPPPGREIARPELAVRRPGGGAAERGAPTEGSLPVLAAACPWPSSKVVVDRHALARRRPLDGVGHRRRGVAPAFGGQEAHLDVVRRPGSG